MTIPKRTIEEVITRLQREKTIREIYVEGCFDRDLIRWSLKQLGLTDIRVYPISTLEIPKGLLENLDLTSGERQRVMAAAKELEEEMGIHSQVLFIIDSDVDYLLDRANYPPPLIGTDGTCAELVLWRKDVIQKFLSLGLGCIDAERLAEDLMAFVEPIVSAVFLLRAAKEKLGAKWRLIEIEDSFNRKSGFDFDAYCKKVGDKNGVHEEMKGVVPNVIEELRNKALTISMSRRLHGHDLIAAFGRKLRLEGYTQKCLGDLDELSRLLMTSLEWSFVCNDPTFIRISEKFSKPELKSSIF